MLFTIAPSQINTHTPFTPVCQWLLVMGFPKLHLSQIESIDLIELISMAKGALLYDMAMTTSRARQRNGDVKRCDKGSHDV